jgi:hypothetical protein
MPAAEPARAKPAPKRQPRDQGQRLEAAWREAREMLRADQPAARAPQTLDSYNAHLRASAASARGNSVNATVRGGDRKI